MDKAIASKSGLGLIEALVCIVVIGIGFIGVNQMISYATGSMDRAIEFNKINFLTETAIEDIMGDPDNAKDYNFSQKSCSSSTYGDTSLSKSKKSKWSKLFLGKDQMKIDGKERKLFCDDRDRKEALVNTATDRTSVKFLYKTNRGTRERKKLIGVVVK